MVAKKATYFIHVCTRPFINHQQKYAEFWGNRNNVKHRICLYVCSPLPSPYPIAPRPRPPPSPPPLALTVHSNYFPRRHFAWHVNVDFWRKENIISVPSAESAQILGKAETPKLYTVTRSVLYKIDLWNTFWPVMLSVPEKWIYSNSEARSGPDVAEGPVWIGSALSIIYDHGLDVYI